MTMDYCDCGSLSSITDYNTNTTYFFYDLAGRLISTHLPDGSWATNIYDAFGRVKVRFDSSGLIETNWYNNQGHRVATSNALGQAFKAIYDIHNRMTVFTDVNGVSR